MYNPNGHPILVPGLYDTRNTIQYTLLPKTLIVFFCCTCCVCCACAHLSAGPRWWGWTRWGDPLALSSSSMLASWKPDCDSHTHRSSIMLSLKIKKGMVRLVFLPCHFPPSTPCATHVFHECSHTLWACALQILVFKETLNTLKEWIKSNHASRPMI